MPNSTFRDLRIRQEAMNLTEEIYRATATQILIARRLQYLPEEEAGKLCRHAVVIGRGLNALIDRFRANAA